MRVEGVPSQGEDTPRMVLCVTDGASYQQVLQDQGRRLLDQGGLACVAANRPATVLRRLFTEAGPERLAFVDCVSSMTGMPPEAEAGVSHVESPALLEKIGMRLDRVMRSLAAPERNLLVDSLSTLAVYNRPEVLAEFTHNILTRLRLQGAGAVFLLVPQSDDDRLLDLVSAHFDAVERVRADGRGPA